jgi:hypothetical protein
MLSIPTLVMIPSTNQRFTKIALRAQITIYDLVHLFVPAPAIAVSGQPRIALFYLSSQHDVFVFPLSLRVCAPFSLVQILRVAAVL